MSPLTEGHSFFREIQKDTLSPKKRNNSPLENLEKLEKLENLEFLEKN